MVVINKLEILENIKVPTGNILVVQGDKGKLEMISVGDYGKEKNIKADFLGLKKEINSVPHGDLIPLEEKWVITVSTQYGCSMGCRCCDVPKVGPGRNATFNDLINQVFAGIKLHPEIKYTKRLNVHYARMGEPSWNSAVLEATKYLAGYFKAKGWGFHPVISTIMPNSNAGLEDFIAEWMIIKNYILEGEAGLQVSINTTDELERNRLFNNNCSSFADIKEIFDMVQLPKERKIALNFALTDAVIDENELIKYFDPKYFMCKITPMHMTEACRENNLITKGGYDYFYPYKDVEQRLKSVGYDVIIFVPSYEEDQGLITCGNAVLSGSRPYGKGIV